MLQLTRLDKQNRLQGTARDSRKLKQERDRLLEELNEDMPVEIQGLQMAIDVNSSPTFG